MFPKIGVPQNGLFIMESPTKMDDFGDFLFSSLPGEMIQFDSYFSNINGLKPPTRKTSGFETDPSFAVERLLKW